MKQFVYLSGPMGGCSFDEMTGWRKLVSESLDSDTVKCLIPTRSYKENNKKHVPIETSKWINRRDYFDCTRANCVLVNLVGMKHLSIGTIMEIAWAYQKQIPVICVVEPDGPQNHPMLQDSITHEVRTLEEGVAYVKEMLSEG